MLTVHLIEVTMSVLKSLADKDVSTFYVYVPRNNLTVPIIVLLYSMYFRMQFVNP